MSLYQNFLIYFKWLLFGSFPGNFFCCQKLMFWKVTIDRGKYIWSELYYKKAPFIISNFDCRSLILTFDFDRSISLINVNQIIYKWMKGSSFVFIYKLKLSSFDEQPQTTSKTIWSNSLIHLKFSDFEDLKEAILHLPLKWLI